MKKILAIVFIGILFLSGCGSSSSKCNIKGNISSSGEKIYHVPGCEYYDETVINKSYGEKWFCSEREARNSGWRRALNCP